MIKVLANHRGLLGEMSRKETAWSRRRFLCTELEVCSDQICLSTDTTTVDVYGYDGYRGSSRIADTTPRKSQYSLELV